MESGERILGICISRNFLMDQSAHHIVILGNELDILIKNLNPKLKEGRKVLALKCEVGVFTYF